jgi:two-component system sensor histidine kinase ChvG
MSDGGEAGEARAKERPRIGRRRLSPITRRILAVNVLALAFLVGGLLYLGEYRRTLVESELAGLDTQAHVFAAAIGEGAVVELDPDGQEMLPDVARQMVRRMVEATDVRARLFDTEGTLLADSRLLLGPGGAVQIEELPPLRPAGGVAGTLRDIYDRVAGWLPGSGAMPRYRESAAQKAADYPEVVQALKGEVGEAVRAVGQSGAMVLSVAAPVQHYKQVLGALMLTKGSYEIDQALFDVRLDILRVFGIALAVTVLLSVYLAGTIARPLHRLAEAAEQVRLGLGRHHVIPDLSRRNDEIGDLSRALRDMTQALWTRMDAIESFAADVAHEIKNPLTSLRSAVETVARIEDPARREKLLSVILDDVQRLDRLITDISDASRLDAELSRAEFAPVDLGRLLAALADMYLSTAKEETPRLTVEFAGDGALTVNGMEGRLVQVFRNLIANAASFSPPGGVIALKAARDGAFVAAAVEDQGPGIPEGKEEAIFERFYSERPAGEKFGTHSGLGLSISRQIVEAHGGTLRAENRRGADGRPIGARFIVRLPAA